MVQRHWEKIIEKVKEEKHITPLQLILELITFNMYKIIKKKGLRKVSGRGGWRRGFLGPCHTSLIKSKNIPSVDNKNTCQFGFLTFYVYVNLQ